MSLKKTAISWLEENNNTLYTLMIIQCLKNSPSLSIKPETTCTTKKWRAKYKACEDEVNTSLLDELKQSWPPMLPSQERLMSE